MIQLEEVCSLKDFQRDAKRHIQRLKRTGRPEAITVNGRAEVVIQDARSYQRLLGLTAQAEAIAAVHESLESMRRGGGKPARPVLKRISRKHRIVADQELPATFSLTS